jgi:hypothetical protein
LHYIYIFHAADVMPEPVFSRTGRHTVFSAPLIPSQDDVWVKMGKGQVSRMMEVVRSIVGGMYVIIGKLLHLGRSQGSKKHLLRYESNVEAAHNIALLGGWVDQTTNVLANFYLTLPPFQAIAAAAGFQPKEKLETVRATVLGPNHAACAKLLFDFEDNCNDVPTALFQNSSCKALFEKLAVSVVQDVAWMLCGDEGEQALIQNMTFLFQELPWHRGTNPFKTPAFQRYVEEMRVVRQEFASGITPENKLLREKNNFDEATQKQFQAYERVRC